MITDDLNADSGRQADALATYTLIKRLQDKTSMKKVKTVRSLFTNVTSLSTARCDWVVIRYDARCDFNVRLKADTSQLNLPHGTYN